MKLHKRSLSLNLHSWSSLFHCYNLWIFFNFFTAAINLLCYLIAAPAVWTSLFKTRVHLVCQQMREERCVVQSHVIKKRENNSSYLGSMFLLHSCCHLYYALVWGENNRTYFGVIYKQSFFPFSYVTACLLCPASSGWGNFLQQ